MQSKSPESLHCKPGTVEINQLGMVTRDQERIEHVRNICWKFFVMWCNTSGRHKMSHRNGEPSKSEIGLQKDCFRNGSLAHKTISQWRRNAEMFVMHQHLLQRDPFKIDTWLVAAYVKQCKDAAKTGARVAFAALKWIDKCCDTPKLCEEPMVLAQIKNDSIQGVVMPKVKKGRCRLLT